MEVFPPHRIMQRVRACVPPMTVEIELTKSRARAPKLMQFVGRQNRDLGGEHLGLGYLDRGLGDCLFVRIVEDLINRVSRAPEQSLSGVKLHFKVADLRDGEDVFMPIRLAAIDPGTHMIAHETDRLIDCAPRDAGVDRRLDDLRYGAV
jgi:hypothetical protein